jgi:hypothetical protein
MRALDTILLVNAVGLALCLAARAELEGSDERFRIRPGLTVTFVGDDNVHQQESDRESAFGSWIAPEVAVDYRRGSFRAQGEFGADVRLYAGEKDFSDSFFRVIADAEYEFLRGFTLRLSNVYLPHPVSLGRPADETGNLVQSNTLIGEGRFRREFKRSTALEVGVQTSWFTAEGFDAYIDLDGDGESEEIEHFHPDYLDFSAFVEGQYSLGRRALLFVRGGARLRDYEELRDSDYTEFSALLGMRTYWARRLRFELMAGYGSIDFDGLGRDGHLVGRANLDYELQHGWTLRGSLGRTLTTDAAGADFGETLARLGVEKRLGRRTRAYLGLWCNWFDSDAGGQRENFSTAVEFRLTRQLTQRIDAALAYRHWRNGGDHSADDFTQNRVTLAFSYRY